MECLISYWCWNKYNNIAATSKNFNKSSVINHVPCHIVLSYNITRWSLFFLCLLLFHCCAVFSVLDSELHVFVRCLFDYCRFIRFYLNEDEWLHRGRRQVSGKFEFKSDENYRCPFKIPLLLKTMEEICEFLFHNLKILYILIRYKLTFGQLSCF